MEYRQYLIERHLESARAFDRSVYALSGGALLLSLTFVSEVVGDASNRRLLFVAWLFFGVSLLANLLSTWAAERDFFHSISAIDRAYKEGAFPDDLERMTGFENWVPWLNLAALIGFIIGVGFLAAFALANLEGG